MEKTGYRLPSDTPVYLPSGTICLNLLLHGGGLGGSYIDAEWHLAK
eukprot:COSAG03_NODE_17809_length_367_cov_1.429104_1_plen_45_part_01